MGKFIGIAKSKPKKYDGEMSLWEISKDFLQCSKTPIVAAKVDHVLKGMQTAAGDYEEIQFVNMEMEAGIKIYQRSVVFLMITAIRELYPDAEVTVEHSISGGLYCEVYLAGMFKKSDVGAIEKHMRQIVSEKRLIVKKILPKEEVIRLFEESGQEEKAHLIASLKRSVVSIYYCGDFYDYLYGPMIPTTAQLGLFALNYYAPGLVLRTPTLSAPTEVPSFVSQPKLARIFAEAEEWAHILQCNYVANLNAHNQKGDIGELIRVSEALHEKKIAQIADFISENIQHIHLILIAGPSSSGKTTFAQRMRVQLRVNGITPVSISLDDYFLDRMYTPRDEKGNYDFEVLEALDVALFNQHLLQLLQGEAVEIPYYNFLTGKREYRGNMIQIDGNQPIIVEGIHGLNEKLTAAVPRGAKYKIYISALTQLAIDGHNRIPTTDTRLLRRMVRDHNSRGSNALHTIRQWPSVRAGEEKNIFPFQEEADMMFNSAMIYELGILKKYAKPLLQAVTQEFSEYEEAVRLLDFLEYFDDIRAEEDVPINSILREFIGRSCFFKE